MFRKNEHNAPGRTRAPRTGKGRLTMAVTTLAVILAQMGPATALAANEYNYSYAERVDMAGAVWITETENSFSDLTIRVSDLSDRSTWGGPTNYKDPGIVMFYTKVETDPITGEETRTEYELFYGGPGTEFDFDRSMGGSTVRFSATAWGYRCVSMPGEPGGEPQGIVAGPVCENLPDLVVTGEIAWTGIGQIYRDADNLREADAPWFMFGSHTVTTSRDATVTGSITADGLDLASGDGTFGVLLRGKYHEQFVSPTH